MPVTTMMMIDHSDSESSDSNDQDDHWSCYTTILPMSHTLIAHSYFLFLIYAHSFLSSGTDRERFLLTLQGKIYYWNIENTPHVQWHWTLQNMI